MKRSALVGHTGFVGSTLKKQYEFDHLFRSTNINEIIDKDYDLLVCAGAPAQKWLANKEPEKDLQQLNFLMNCLSRVKAKKFVLISTVDVFAIPQQVTEDSEVSEANLSAYGLNRRILEKFVVENFPDVLIVRLSGLVGPGLKKNIIFDFLNNNNLNQIESRSVFQFYPMVNLWSDITCALFNNLSLVHLTSEPISVEEVALEAFNLVFENELSSSPLFYDFRTKYSDLFKSVCNNYQYSKKETLIAIRAYAQSEQVKK